jgi:hypothetical protein
MPKSYSQKTINMKYDDYFTAVVLAIMCHVVLNLTAKIFVSKENVMQMLSLVETGPLVPTCKGL